MQYQEIAVKIGVTPETLSNWLGGRRHPSKNKMLVIEDQFEWPISEQMAAFNVDTPGGKPGEYGRQFRAFLEEKWEVAPRG